MKYQFLNIFLDEKELLKQEGSPINPTLLENNSNQIEKIYDFYKNDTNLLCINGFLGTGKAQVVNYSLTLLSPETIVLKYNCFNSTILDDILLVFFNEFKKLSAKQIISEPKIKTENFSQKINSYFAQIEKPFVIILDSFEEILKENRQEILDFIFHLTTFPKIKIILIGRNFESETFDVINHERITNLALNKNLFEKYLKANKIKLGSIILDEFYKYTRGYYFFTTLSINIMASSGLTLMDFIKEFKNSFLSFDAFLEKKTVSLIPATYRNLFWFLAMIRHPVSIDLLKTLKLYDEERINFLKKNFIITQEDSLIYIQDYFKEQLDESVAPNIAHKIHQYIIDLYQTQLPLKPLERNVLVSRQTMRKEIEYHALFLPKKHANIDNPDLDINYLTYAKGLDVDYRFTSLKSSKEGEQQASATTNPTKKIAGDLSTVKGINLNLENLSFGSDTDTEHFAQKTPPKPPIANEGSPQEFQAKEQQTPQTYNIKELLELSGYAEEGYHYSRIIELCKRALALKDDTNYSTHLPLIYNKIAFAYEKMADYENALNFYDLEQNFYEGANEFVKANYVKLHISTIFYQTYRLEKAKEILLDIIKYKENPPILITKTYILLANLENDFSNVNGAFEYYKKAIDASTEDMDAEVLSELYFKYALTLDDKNDAGAIKYYEKCIELSDDNEINQFLSSAYSNIATLYAEKNDTNSAVKNYLKAYEIDKKNNNYDGMYYAASKLASVLQRKYPDKALVYLKTALECAKFLNDMFYIASASLAIGDFYYDKKQNEMALKHYFYIFELVKNDFSKDNVDKIQIRINDIKFRLGEDAFANVIDTLREEQIGQE